MFQFLSGTWLDTLQKHGAKHGLEWASQQIEQTGRGPIIRDPAVRDQVLALRYDPQISSLMAGEYASDNRQALQTSTGREPTATDLYLAHFLGPAGAGDFLRNMQTNPGASAATFFPQAAAANRAIFYAEGGGARSLGEVYGLLGAKVAGAIDRNGGATFQDFDPSLALAPGAAAQVSAAPPEWTAARQEWAEASNRPSMSEVLRSSFGVGSNGADAASANVNKAYGALKAFDL